ncbi:MAG: magnesium chelatase subunit D [Pseudomonadota bacterium]
MSAPSPWADAGLAAALLAVDPVGLGGLALRARHGPVRETWLAGFRSLLPEGTPQRRLPPRTDDERLLGGLDLVATLDAGRPVASRGLLAECDGGVVTLTMAERAERGLVARLTRALDTGEVRTERDGLSRVSPTRIAVLALDEGAEADERPPAALLDRLAFRIDLSAVTAREATSLPYNAQDVAIARAALPRETLPVEATEALVATAAAFGIGSARAALLALRTAQALRALLRLAPEEAAEIAARLVLAPRATQIPSEASEPEEAPPDPPDPGEEETESAEDTVSRLTDRVLEATEAAIPAGLLEALSADAKGGREGDLGRAGAERQAPDRGRPIGARPGRPGGGRRIDIVATLRAAAPWQRLRADGGPARVHLRAGDLRIRRFKRRSASATVFVVDASGSTAMARLAEAKGAVEILLAEAYVRRDLVALVAFRGDGADVLLPPTAAPALARRRLAELPGGGGTPLAAGIDAAAALARRLAERGTAPQLVLLTDGRANIDRRGHPGRPAATEDATASARAARAAGLQALVIDTGPRPRPEAAALAKALGGPYLALPRADAHRLSAAARAARAL